MTETPPSRPLSAADLSEDPWNVMRGLLPAGADVPLLLAARAAAWEVLMRIIKAERRPGLDSPTRWLLEIARMSAIGRIAMLDNWRGNLTGSRLVRKPYGEDTHYARVMRMRPEQLREVIAITSSYGPEVLEVLRGLDPPVQRSSLLIGDNKGR